ncbi:MAG: hypothetical protein IJL42_08915 [Bacteroidales bacterium]|jgi:hypothetical protein|nr:hypothetical protein [Bacteroidales bacterium]
MAEGQKWKIQDVGRLLKESVKAILHGQFLLRLNIGRYFIHIVWTFFLFGMLIWFSLGVDSTLAKVEKNQAAIKELEIEHSNLEFELRTLNRRAALEEMLKEAGSKVTEPQKPATVLKK